MNRTLPPGFMSFRVYRVLWAALFIPQLFYTYVLFGVLAKNWERTNPRWLPNFSDGFELGLCVAAAVSAAASVFLPPLIAAMVPRADADPGTVEKDLVPTRFFPSFLVRLGLTDVVCVFGFLLAFVRQMPELFTPFVILSTVLFLKSFPSDPKKIAADLGR